MPLFEMTDSDFREVHSTSFGNENVMERQDLQRLLRDHISEIAPNCMVIAEEFCNWENSQRRIDLLCVDSQGKLVVIELKRGQTGQHMDLQALRYAAMVSAMTFAQAVDTYKQYASNRPGTSESPEEDLRKFIVDADNEDDSSQPEETFNRDREVRIILVSSGFSKELTTTVLWLWYQNIDIRCIRMTPYRHEGKLLVLTEQIIPLPEAEVYQEKIAVKNAEAKSVRSIGARLPKDLTFEITVCGNAYPHLQYEQAVFQAIELLRKQCGVSLENIQASLPVNRLVPCEGRLNCDEIKTALEQMKGPRGKSISPAAYYCGDDHLIFDGGRTWVLKRLSPKGALHRLELLKTYFPTQLDFRQETDTGGSAE